MVTLPVTFALEPQFKETFATFLNSGFSPFPAALRIWPKDPGLAAQVAATWVNDPYVVAFREKLNEDAETAKKPASKEAQVKRIEERIGSFPAAEYLKGERLIAEMLGHIEKAAPPSVTVNANQQVVERVLVYKDHGSNDDWQAKLMLQQSKLIEGNVDG